MVQLSASDSSNDKPLSPSDGGSLFTSKFDLANLSITGLHFYRCLVCSRPIGVHIQLLGELCTSQIVAVFRHISHQLGVGSNKEWNMYLIFI